MTSNTKIYAIVAAFVGWASLLLQLILFLSDRTVTVAMALLRFFTYFTILTNLLAALLFTAFAVPRTRASWLTQPGTVTAVTAYMIVVALVFNTLLRGLLQLTGLNSVLNELLHVLLPMATLLFWLLFVPKSGLRWRSAFSWLLYPFAYILWVILVGALTRFYPYPFTDVTVLGYPRALTNGLVILVGFLAIFFLMIAVGRIRMNSSGSAH